MAKKLSGFFPPNAPGGSGGVKAGTTIDDDWVVRTIAHIRRRSRSIDSAIGETPAWFSAREEQNTAPSSPTRKDDVSSLSAVRHSCNGSGGDGGGSGAMNTEKGNDWWRAGVGSSVSGDVRSVVIGEIDAHNFMR